MKKIRLNVANLNGTEILSREQLKSIFGGSGSGSGSDSLNGGYVTCGLNAAGTACATSGICQTSSGTGGCQYEKVEYTDGTGYVSCGCR